MTRIKRIRNMLVWTLIISALVVLGIWGFWQITGRFFGWHYGAVITGSMKPELKVGDMVISSPVEGEDVKVGDMITFVYKGARITHRVTEVGYDTDNHLWLQTKGDANEVNDPFLIKNFSGLQRVRTHIPKLGYIAIGLKTRFGFLALFVLGVLACSWILSHIWAGKKEEGKHERRESYSVSSAVSILPNKDITPQVARIDTGCSLPVRLRVHPYSTSVKELRASLNIARERKRISKQSLLNSQKTYRYLAKLLKEAKKEEKKRQRLLRLSMARQKFRSRSG